MNTSVVLFTSSELNSTSDFLNDFLDPLIENYCKDKFIEGENYNGKLISNICLSTLLLYAYPDFHLTKEDGLLGHNKTTEVKLVYKKENHKYLSEALNHKIKKLFLNVFKDNLIFLKKEGRKDSSYSRFTFDFTYYTINPFSTNVKRPLDVDVYPETRYISNDNLDNIIIKLYLISHPYENIYIYKPNVIQINDYLNQIKLLNKQFIESSEFFDNQAILSNQLVFLLALAFKRESIGILNKYFTNDFSLILKTRADEVLFKLKDLKVKVVESKPETKPVNTDIEVNIEVTSDPYTDEPQSTLLSFAIIIAFLAFIVYIFFIK